MQVVHHADEFESALNLCQSRAQSAFGDSRVFVEKFIEGAQHVEFQVLADGKKQSISVSVFAPSNGVIKNCWKRARG
ncbi:MAG: hypothetical protein Ct9H90mP16_15720 [Candidatus Poseidoniales archaeon]|nr:MAG: hypothetical protein Ct9H90mP16_15720 [Candidatus Poseidoniales archaeon]